MEADEAKMDLIIDPDVKAAAEFLQRNVATNRLVSVAECLASLAPILWGRYDKQRVAPLLLLEPPIITSAGDPHTPQGAIESFPVAACVGDDFVEAIA